MDISCRVFSYFVLLLEPTIHLFFDSRDVGYETYKAHRRGPPPEEASLAEQTRLGMVAVQRATFQSIASMCILLTQLSFRALTTITQGTSSFHNSHGR